MPISTNTPSKTDKKTVYKSPASGEKKESAGGKAVAKKGKAAYYEWTAPARPFRRRTREFWVSVVTMAFVASIILFIIDGLLPVLLVISVVLLFYVLTTVKPEDIRYRVSKRGFEMGDKVMSMDNIIRFWFTKRFDNHLLVLQIATIPGKIEVVINERDKKGISRVLSKYIRHEEAPPTNMDKMANWLSERIPGNVQ